MISKLTTGNGFTGSIRYDLRTGKGTEQELVKVLDADGVTIDFDDDFNMVIDPSMAAFEFRQQVMAYKGKGTIRKPVYHWSLSYSPNDQVTEEMMREDARDFMKRIGFDNTQYIMVAHYDKAHKHIHLITNLINNQAERISTYKLIDKAHKATADITKARGYQWGEKATKETIENAHRPHEKVRMLIKPILKEAVAKAESLDELKSILASKGISCETILASDGKRCGISFAYEYEGQLHTFRGSSLDRQLSYGYVKAAIDKNSARDKEAEFAEETDFSTFDLN